MLLFSIVKYMRNQKGGKGLGGLFGSISKLAKAGSKAASKVVTKATESGAKVITNATNVAQTNASKVKALSSNAVSEALSTNVLNSAIDITSKEVTLNSNTDSGFDSNINMNCSCSCKRQIQTEKIQIGGYETRNIRDAALKLIHMNKIYNIGSNVNVSRIERGLTILSKHGFNINNDNDYFQLMHHNKFDNKPGFKTILNALST